MARSLIKDGIYFTVGLAAVSKDTVEKIVKRIVKEGVISMKEGQTLVHDVLRESDKAQKNIRGLVGKQLKEAVEKELISAKRELKRKK
jgi:polyhydroxyalkanoate synthesis regulator phasin